MQAAAVERKIIWTLVAVFGSPAVNRLLYAWLNDIQGLRDPFFGAAVPAIGAVAFFAWCIYKGYYETDTERKKTEADATTECTAVKTLPNGEEVSVTLGAYRDWLTIIGMVGGGLWGLAYGIAHEGMGWSTLARTLGGALICGFWASVLGWVIDRLRGIKS